MRNICQCVMMMIGLLVGLFAGRGLPPRHRRQKLSVAYHAARVNETTALTSAAPV